MTIRLYNTLSRSKEELVPVIPGQVSMYVCGPTVYDRAHLGNARPVVVFDVLYRLLRQTYGAANVRYVRNFTDVDDKIIDRAKATGRPIEAITGETTQWYLEDMAALGALEPGEMPRATGWIGAMVAMIGDLIARGHAYEAEGHVLFSVGSYAEYGRLSGRSVDDMIAGARVEVAPYKRDPMDFVLWKPSGADQPGWESPWGRGRPGWHIECSAMSHGLLGESFDIHGGGIDLQFPHHENEIAQSMCAHPEGGFAKVWMHNEMLQVEGKKMSKSLGNFFTVRDLLEQGVPGEVIRFVFLQTHYRKPMDWTEKKRAEAEATLRKWRTMCYGRKPAKLVPEEMLHHLSDDLNTPACITYLHRCAGNGNSDALIAGARALGLLSDELGGWFSLGEVSISNDDNLDSIVKLRQEARDSQQWAKADEIRDELVSVGVVVADGRGASSAYIEPLLLFRLLTSAVAEAWAEGDMNQIDRAVERAIFFGLKDPLPGGRLRPYSTREAAALLPQIKRELAHYALKLGAK